MKINIMLQMDPPAKSKYPPHEDPEMSVEAEVRQAIEMIESGHDSLVEWKLLNKLARELRRKKDPRSKRLMDMIDPVLQKYGIHGDHAGNDEA